MATLYLSCVEKITTSKTQLLLKWHYLHYCLPLPGGDQCSFTCLDSGWKVVKRSRSRHISRPSSTGWWLPTDSCEHLFVPLPHPWHTQRIGAKNVTGSERNTARLWQLLQTALNKAFTHRAFWVGKRPCQPLSLAGGDMKSKDSLGLWMENCRRLSTFCNINLKENNRMLKQKLKYYDMRNLSHGRNWEWQ